MENESPMSVLEGAKFENSAGYESMTHVFEAQVVRVPKKIGLVVGNKTFTYEQINEKANQVANYIHSMIKLHADALVALCLERTEFMIFAILGVWKAGGAYIPIDSKYPPARINLILKDSQPILVLTDSSSFNKISSIKTTGFPILDISTGILNNFSTISSTSVIHCGENLAFIIYTSGTTGNPKGVMIEQKCLVNQCMDYPLRYDDLTEDDVVVVLFNYVFNAFMEPVTQALSQGLRLVIVPYEYLMDPTKFIEYLRVNEASHIDGTPSLVSQYNFSSVKTLKRIVVGGELLTQAQKKYLLRQNPSLQIYNVYGSTEGTLCSMTQNVSLIEETSRWSRAVVNKKVYVVNNDMELVSIGETGELCLVGNGIVRGYLNNEILTTEKFIQNPFQTDEEKATGKFPRLFKTGDLVAVNSKGISYVARKDLQVKIRGIRVEIGEVENTILKFPGINRVAVTCSEKTEGNQLIGYFDYNEVAPKVNIEQELLEFLKKNLPEYMIPSLLYRLKEFPLTVNGKVNRAELRPPTPPPNEMSSSTRNNAEYNLNEIAVCEIWEDVLSLPPNTVEKTNNFFSLGGNSLLAIKVINIIKKKLGIELNTTRLIEGGGNFQSFLISSIDVPVTSVELIPQRSADARDPPFSTAQDRIWMSKDDYSCHHINFEFDVNGSDFDSGVFTIRLLRIINRHEILRTIFIQSRYSLKYQKILPTLSQLDFDLIPTTEEDLVYQIDKFCTQRLDLSTYAPLRIGIFEINSRITKVVILIHSITMDLAGESIFLEELIKSDEQYPLEVQYADYAQYQENYNPSDEARVSVTYWKGLLSKFCRPLSSLSTHVTGSDINTVKFKLDSVLCNTLRALAQEMGLSLYSVLLSAHLLMIRFLEPNDLMVTTGTFVSARDHPQLYHLLGNFTHLIPVCAEVSQEYTVKALLKSTFQIINLAKIQQHFPMDMTTVAAGGVKNLSNHPYFKYIFDANIMTQPEMKIVMDGCNLTLRSVKRNPQFLTGTQFFTQVDTSYGKLQGFLAGRHSVEFMEKISTIWLKVVHQIAGIHEIGDLKVMDLYSEE